jgi:hypothetical protein
MMFPYDPILKMYITKQTDITIPVLKDLPSEFGGQTNDNRRYKQVAAVIDGELCYYHYCSLCNGWIEGSYNEEEINSIGPLSGRKGQSRYCRRCGHEAAFFGKYS